jgi:hypothetical protein
VVSQLRDSSHFDVAAAIRMLAAPVSPLEVHVDAADRLVIDDPVQAHAILRCV